MAVVHSEIHTNLMGKPVYEYLSGRSLCSLKVSIEDIPDEEAQRKCIEACDNHQELKTLSNFFNPFSCRILQMKNRCIISELNIMNFS